MKALLLIIALTLTSCSGSNQYGECVGIDDSDRNPELEYKLSVRNAFWSIVGFETIIAPILWATDYAYCPVGRKAK